MIRRLANKQINIRENMKINKLSLIPMLALGGLMAFGSMASAQDNKEGGGAPPPGGPPPGGGRRGGMPTVEQQMERLTTELKLTDEQKPKVKAVLEETSKKRQEMRADTSLSQEDRQTKNRAIIEEQGKKMKGILTPEQYEKYQTLRPPMRPNRGGGAGGPPAGGPPAGAPPAGEKKSGN